MVICAVLVCGNRSKRDKGKRFFRLPTVLEHQGGQTKALSEKRQGIWLSRIRREDVKPEQYYNVRVCGDHFHSGAPSKLYPMDDPDWAPSLKLGYDTDTDTQQTTERYDRAVNRRFKRMVTRMLESDDETDEMDCNLIEEAIESPITHSSVQTDITFAQVDEDFENITSLKKEIHDLRKENETLKETVTHLQLVLQESTMNEASFKGNDQKVLFYTGLSTWSLFMTLFTYIKPYLHVGGNSTLSPFQQLLITLIRLRLNLQIQDLGYRFNIHNSTVSRAFLRVIDVLHMKLIRWPDRDALKKTMPMTFRKHFPTCVVIIDCFEIFLDRPTNLLARAQTYSSYKHHNTVKYLIGITPQGTVSFISNGWGGRTSDKYITEHSTLYNNLLPGDTILADRGFDIKESVALLCSNLVLPAFTKGKKQLDPIAVEQTRTIANVRIHVERVIGNVRKKYSLLSDTQPVDFVISTDNEETTLDKIVTVSCALINMCDSVIPFD